MDSPDSPKPARPSIDFDQNSAEFATDPWSKYEELRSSCPVAHTDTPAAPR